MEGYLLTCVRLEFSVILILFLDQIIWQCHKQNTAQHIAGCDDQKIVKHSPDRDSCTRI